MHTLEANKTVDLKFGLEKSNSMEPNVIALVLLILGVIAEGVRRAWSNKDAAIKKDAEFQQQREEAIKTGDRFKRYNRN